MCRDIHNALLGAIPFSESVTDHHSNKACDTDLANVCVFVYVNVCIYILCVHVCVCVCVCMCVCVCVFSCKLCSDSTY